MGVLDGNVCIVTGGAVSLGLAAARHFLPQGACVMLADLQAAALDQAARSLDREHAQWAVADVSHAPADIRSCHDGALARYPYTTGTLLVLDRGMRV